MSYYSTSSKIRIMHIAIDSKQRPKMMKSKIHKIPSAKSKQKELKLLQINKTLVPFLNTTKIGDPSGIISYTSSIYLLMSVWIRTTLPSKTSQLWFLSKWSLLSFSTVISLSSTVRFVRQMRLQKKKDKLYIQLLMCTSLLFAQLTTSMFITTSSLLSKQSKISVDGIVIKERKKELSEKRTSILQNAPSKVRKSKRRNSTLLLSLNILKLLLKVAIKIMQILTSFIQFFYYSKKLFFSVFGRVSVNSESLFLSS